MKQTIEILIKPDGQTLVQTKGFTGESCRDASRLIEQALGRRESEELTAEFHQAATTHDTVRQQSS